MDNILKRYCRKHNIVLLKGESLHILLTLAWNRVLILKLQLLKWIKGIHHPIVHYYAVCWNEEKMLPFMFDYYGLFVDRFTIYDNYSDDRSEEIIRSHKNAEIVKFKTDGFDDSVNAKIKNNCWKQSRGKADFVIVCDMDEFVYHSQIGDFISDMKKHKVSLPTPKGYEMYSETFPKYSKDADITQLVKTGIPDDYYSKCLLFDPHRIVEINYTPGAHVCNPRGQVVRGSEYKVLHYKNLDVEAVLSRNRTNAKRLSDYNLVNGFGSAYMEDDKQVRSKFERNIAKTVIVVK